MRENEKAALQEVLDRLTEILGGNIPAAAAPVATARTFAKPATRPAPRQVAEPTGEPNIQLAEDGWYCLIDNAGPMKIAELAVYMWQTHGVPMSQIAGEGLDHGRKWQMSQALKKAGLTDALEGYGRGAGKAPARSVRSPAEAESIAQPKAKPKWAKKPAQAPTVTGTSDHLNLHYAFYTPTGNVEDAYWVIIEGPWDPNSKMIAISELYGDKVFEVPKRNIRMISPWTAAEIPPEKAAQPKVAPPARKPWQKKATTTAPASEEDEDAFKQKYGINDKQVAFVRQHMADNNIATLEEAAKDLELPVAQVE